jgi:threonine synthase
MARQLQKLRVNPNVRRVVCSASGHEVETREFSQPVRLCACCPAPGKPVVVEYDLEAARAEILRAGSYLSPDPGLASFTPLLPVIGFPPHYAADVGHTPIVAHEPLGAEFGVDVLLKNEGTNPSGSFKDRGLSVAVALGTACGAARFCLPTQGNAGVAASLFSARLGLPGCLVYMPHGYQDSIYHRQATFFGAEVRFSGQNIAAAGRRMRANFEGPLASGEIVDLSTFFEPGRLEGKKTMGLEIAHQLGGDGLPGFILYPTGGGTGLVGIWKAFGELVSMGFLEPDRLPALVAVQSANCAPVVRSFERGLHEVEPVESLGTIADGLDVPGAIMGHGMLRAIRDSGGSAVAVQEEEIVQAFATCGRFGITASYESAALVAALGQMRQRGAIPDESRVLLLLTASHLIPLGQR